MMGRYGGHGSYDEEDEDCDGMMVKSFSLGIARQPPINFVKARNESEESEIQQTKESSGKSVASFYRELVQPEAKDSLSNVYETCLVCGVPIQDPERHHLNSAHLSALANPQAPLRPLSIETSSVGYQYLLRHGWSPYDIKGLGAKGREGSRTPVQVQMKNDKVGIGLDAPLSNESERPPQKLLKSKKDAELYEAEDKRKRKRVFQDLYGDPKLAEYFG